VIRLEAGAPAGIIDLNASFWIELAAFLIMLGLLARYAYPRVINAAEARQRQIAEQLAQADKAREEAEKRLQQAEARLEQARAQAQEIIQGATRSGEQLREELRAKAAEDAKRVIERARGEIEAERQRALDSVRRSVADLVVAATEKVIGETLDERRHRKLIDEAIKEVGNGRRRG
jgi:F-type H+-transporting ATPase subunit b